MNTKERILYFIKGKGFNADEAMTIYNVYTKENIIIIDKHTGAWSFLRGTFADRGVMNNALHSMPDKTPGQIIIDQMGGMGKLTAMVGAYMFVDLGNGIKFKFKGSRKSNLCQVIYDSDTDLYTFELWHIGQYPSDYKKVYNMGGVYSGMLIELFEDKTGLYLSL